MKTQQEIFDQVVAHARQMTEKSRSKNGRRDSCQYRTDCGNSCFIGCLIPDDKYNPEIEDLTPGSLPDGFLVSCDLPDDKPMISFFDDIQEIHDSCDMEVWEDQFNKFAEEWNLVYKEVF